MITMSAALLCTPLLWIVNFQYIRSFGKVKRISLVQIWVLIVHIGMSYTILKTWYWFIYLSIVLHLSHLLFFIISEIYIRKNTIINQKKI
jgi:hypothetical protein